MFNISDLYICKKCPTCDKLSCNPLCQKTANEKTYIEKTAIDCTPGYMNPPSCRTAIPTTSYTNDQLITTLNSIAGTEFNNSITYFLQQVPTSKDVYTRIPHDPNPILVFQLSFYVIILKTNIYAPYTYFQSNGASNSFSPNSVMDNFKKNIISSNMGDLVDVTYGGFWWNNNGTPTNSPGYINIDNSGGSNSGYLTNEAWVLNDATHNQKFFPNVVKIDNGRIKKMLGVLLIGPTS